MKKCTDEFMVSLHERDDDSILVIVYQLTKCVAFTQTKTTKAIVTTH